jgi:type I restriction enzyme M protein
VTDVAARLWNFCHTLRHEGVDYGDYIEQLTYLLFLKLANEHNATLPPGTTWQELIAADDEQLLSQYQYCLSTLSEQDGILGDIYFEARVRIANPSSLRQLLSLIDQTRWSALGEDVQAAAFEGLLERAASEGKKGAGQYFTPRPLIDAIVRCLRPLPDGRPDFTIYDPACGTGGFLVAAQEWLEANVTLTTETSLSVLANAFHGQELVSRPRQLALMNLYLRGVTPHIRLGDSLYGSQGRQQHDIILTNPPFGTKGTSETPSGEEFHVKTTSKQLNFIQLVAASLKRGGRAAIVLPDNALFADQAADVFRNLMATHNVHTVLRCPAGTFTPYTEGTNTNVVFFSEGLGTQRTWVYDARTNTPKITRRTNPLLDSHFAGFVDGYGDDPSALGRDAHIKDSRWRSFTLDDVSARGYKLDALRWLDEDNGLKENQSVKALIAQSLESLSALQDVLEDLEDLVAEHAND